MRLARSMLIPLGLACSLGPLALADTVHLKNGRRIDGKVTDNRATSGEVVVAIGDVGTVILRAREVEKIEAAPAGAAATRERVSVKVPGARYYTGGEDVIEGVLSPESDSKTVVLEVDGGKVWIERTEKTEVKRSEAAAEPKPAAFVEEGGKRLIKTTHVVHLKNGRKLQGNVVPTPEAEPLRLEVGGLGRLLIARDKIAADGVKEAAGAIEVPEEPKPVPPEKVERQPTEAEVREALKKQIRAELLRELLDRAIDEKVDEAAASGRMSHLLRGVQTDLTNDDVLAIQDAVRELGRQRSQNRVRAERHLASMGSAVLPYLEPLAAHPFELTRRAVQRIVRDIGDLRGAPIAIEALNDPDAFVRAHAREALERLLPSAVRYRPDDPERSRLAAQAEYRALWEEAVREGAREAILRGLAAQE